MGLFGKKKTGGSDSPVAPKCEYCEFGRPAKSAGKILCTRCGIVSIDSSCKKYRYSSARFTEALERDKKDTKPDLLESAAAAEQSQISQTPDTTVQNRPFTGIIPEELPQKQPEASPAPNIIPQPILGSTVESSRIIKDEIPKPSPTIPQPTKAQAAPEEKAVSVSFADIKMPYDNTKHFPDAQPPEVGNIRLFASDNSEKIRKLYETQTPTVGGIVNHVPKKEIILPDVDSNSVKGIALTGKKMPSAEERLGYVTAPTLGNLK